jgi:hypothetical protein
MNGLLLFIFLFAPIAIFAAVYILAWRVGRTSARKATARMLTIICGVTALFGSWWAFGMSLVIWLVEMPQWEISFLVPRALLEIVVLSFPGGLWYLCVRFARLALISSAAGIR